MENQNGRTDARLEGYRLVDQVGGVALLYPELSGAPAALSDEACAWVRKGKLYVMPGQSVGEVPLGPLLALLERAGVTASCPEQPHTGALADSESVPERTTPEPRPEQIEIDGVLVAGGVTDSEPYIMRDNGIETVAVYQSNGNVYFPCGSFIPSAALVELLRRSGSLEPSATASESRAPAGASVAAGRASLGTRRKLLSALQEAESSIRCNVGDDMRLEEVERLIEVLDAAYSEVNQEGSHQGNPAAWAFGIELPDYEEPVPTPYAAENVEQVPDSPTSSPPPAFGWRAFGWTVDQDPDSPTPRLLLWKDGVLRAIMDGLCVLHTVGPQKIPQEGMDELIRVARFFRDSKRKAGAPDASKTHADPAGPQKQTPAIANGRASLQVRRQLLDALQACADAVEQCQRGETLHQPAAERLFECLNDAYEAVYEQNELAENPAEWAFGVNLPDAELKTRTTAESSPDDLREAGWSVAIHNDYQLDGVSYTFWLLTNGNRCVKGEGFDDASALQQIRHSLRTSESSGPNKPLPSALTRYTDLVGMLLNLRKENGGSLPDRLESAFVERLDELWWEMSEEEQEQAEESLGSRPHSDGDAAKDPFAQETVQS